jgi:hypothetical protein
MDAIADGELAGRFQGSTEWDPHVGGNRSILSDPQRVDRERGREDQAVRIVRAICAPSSGRRGQCMV